MRISSHGFVMIAYLSSILYAVLILWQLHSFLLYGLLVGVGIGIALWDTLVWHHGEKIVVEEK